MRIAHWPALTSMLVGLLVGTALISVPSTADAAARTVLCSGYSQCAATGYGHGGYASARHRSYWNQTPGRSCTNYVAYRLTKNRLVARPPGTGAARTWGTAARAAGLRVSTTGPRVGDVAWWKAGKGLAGAKGHVAIVERVRKDGSVVVSEDNMNRTFLWRIVRKGSGWPSGFIRFPTSDGSPAGVLEGFEAADGIVTVRGSASEPDRWGRALTYTVALGAPLDAGPTETFTFSTAYYRFTWRRTVDTRGPVRAYLYAHNTDGTAGSDQLLGAATLEVPDLGSRVGALLPRDQWLLPAPDVPGVLTPP